MGLAPSGAHTSMRMPRAALFVLLALVPVAQCRVSFPARPRVAAPAPSKEQERGQLRLGWPPGEQLGRLRQLLAGLFAERRKRRVLAAVIVLDWLQAQARLHAVRQVGDAARWQLWRQVQQGKAASWSVVGAERVRARGAQCEDDRHLARRRVRRRSPGVRVKVRARVMQGLGLGLGLGVRSGLGLGLPGSGSCSGSGSG